MKSLLEHETQIISLIPISQRRLHIHALISAKYQNNYHTNVSRVPWQGGVIITGSLRRHCRTLRIHTKVQSDYCRQQRLLSLVTEGFHVVKITSPRMRLLGSKGEKTLLLPAL